MIIISHDWYNHVTSCIDMHDMQPTFGATDTRKRGLLDCFQLDDSVLIRDRRMSNFLEITNWLIEDCGIPWENWLLPRQRFFLNFSSFHFSILHGRPCNATFSIISDYSNIEAIERFCKIITYNFHKINYKLKRGIRVR